MDLPELNQEPTREEMRQLLSQTIIKQDEQIKNLKNDLQNADKCIAELKDELNKPCQHVMEAEESVRMRHLTRYLEHEIDYAKTKITELRHHLIDYPEDEYSKVDLQNSLLHLNYLHAMMRRLQFYS